MQITALQTFLTIVETGSLVRASEQLNVTQSTVTMRLKGLESETGQRLLHRQKSGVVLTPAGTKLLEYAQVITGLWRQALMETGLPDGFNRLCNVGCTPDLWSTAGKDLCDFIKAAHPEMALSVLLGSETDLEGWLNEGKVDICLCHEPLARSKQSVYRMGEDDLVLYSDRPKTPARFDTHYVFVDHGPEFRRQHGEEYYDADTARMSFNSSTAALDYLLEHSGSAYLPRATVLAHARGKKLHEVAAAVSFSRSYYLVVADLQLKQTPSLQKTLLDFSESAPPEFVAE